ncbi:MAG TPA: alanine--tRNA ligase [Alphaproteobacteria bacterium]|nr:alanine--tRNA ligase [Alphaproteobacteria bacterium]
MLTTNEIRQKFLKYFESKGHTIVKSSPTVPDNDPTLLFTNAGMVQFKNVFLGEEKRDYTRATSSQKCVRAGGKHNDLENVGHTARHHTFFEMLGNFSFGDYFKAEAIPFAWEFLTKELGLPADKLVATVYHTDDEAFEIWNKVVGLPEDRIIRITTNDNFWSMGDTGPCGPCTEIFYDHGEDIWGGLPGTPEEDGDRFIEIWNVVFMQYNKQEDGTMLPLAQTGVDTGCGLERLVATLQHVNNNYDIDSFQTIIKGIEKEIGIKITDETLASYRVIADHLRAMSFLIADGVMPSNEGRGYVLRRIMRRAMRHANLLGSDKSFIFSCIKYLVDVSGEDFPELKQAQSMIEDTVKNEEDRFNKTLHQGIKVLEAETAGLKEGDTLSGDVAFKLYDTFGFPLDLTEDALKSRGINVDEEGFNVCMQEQKDRARAAGLGGSTDSKTSTVWFDVAAKVEATEFVGYDKMNSISKIVAIINEDMQEVKYLKIGETGYVVLDKTPFYAEAGGQVGDQGYFKKQENNTEKSFAEISDTQKVVDGKIYHHKISSLSDTIFVGDSLYAEVSFGTRKYTECNHTAAHLFHAALHKVVGKNVFQKGSLVDKDRMRFDFSLNQALTDNQIAGIEQFVNYGIVKNIPVETFLMSKEEAIEKGAVALFGEKYNDEVRVVSIGGINVSIELCGGTHVKNTGEIGLFRILSEGSIASGIRRVEAITSFKAINHLSERDNQLISLEKATKFKAEELEERFATLNKQVRKLEKELAEIKVNAALNPEQLLASAKEVNGLKLITATATDVDVKQAREVVADVKNRADNIVFALGLETEKGSNLLVGLSKALTPARKAGDLMKKATEGSDLRGGGAPDLATAGGPKLDSFDAIFAEIEKAL